MNEEHMKSDLHRHLDGDLPADALDAGDRGRADQWERMVASFRTAAPRGDAPPWLEQRVMSEIAALPARGPMRRALAWLVKPASVRLSPLAGALAAAALVFALAWDPREGALPSAPAAGATVYVQFMLDAPSATSVAVAGDFSDWEPAFSLDDSDGDGVWTARVPVQPGVYAYMFLVDETSWLTDPNAGRYQDDGFGNRNAVLAVGASS
jgi:hypothetical protein